MSNTFSLDTLTEGIRQRHLSSHNKQLVEKWSRTGLLRGLDGNHRENMSRLLENQASQVLREASSVGAGGGSMSASGDLRGFTNIAFPIVRRVFGGLVANDLVSIQPMSLPSGLLFYLDYTYGSDGGNPAGSDGATYASGSSIYNGPTGKAIRQGSDAVGGLYDLAGSGFTRAHTGQKLGTSGVIVSGSFGNGTVLSQGTVAVATGSDAKLLQFDPQILKSIEDQAVPGGSTGPAVHSFVIVRANLLSNFDASAVKELSIQAPDAGNAPDAGLAYVTNDASGNPIQGDRDVLNIRRLNQLGTWTGTEFVPDGMADLTAASTGILTVVSGVMDANTCQVNYPIASTLASNAGEADTLVIPSFESDFDPSNPQPSIPEIDIKVEAVPVVAETRKLRARWSPELAQDLNAYHSLDAEVELTQILSEQIAL